MLTERDRKMVVVGVCWVLEAMRKLGAIDSIAFTHQATDAARILGLTELPIEAAEEFEAFRDSAAREVMQ